MTTLRQFVRERAGHRCEFCRVHSALQCATFHIDHVRPVSRGGTDEAENLAFACPTCNLSKSNRQTLTDPDTGDAVPLFNPRRDRWSEHFRFEGYTILGLTAIGRAMVAGFQLNSSQYILIRSVEEQVGIYPPPHNS
jgi:hypothetical protein